VADKQRVWNAIAQKLGLETRTGKERNAWFTWEGRRILRVTVPKGRGEIAPSTLRSIANQLRLTVRQLEELVNCRLGRDEWIRILQDKGLLG
jgi:hypothetical protein